MPTYTLRRDLDSNQCRIMYDCIAGVVKRVMEDHYGHQINALIVSMKDTTKPYSYTLLKSRTIVLNTDDKSFNLFGEAANYVAKLDSEPWFHYTLLVTTMIDDVCHELHHLLLPTDSQRYANDKAYAMVIENTVKLNTLDFLISHYNEISKLLVQSYDVEFLKIIQSQYRTAIVEPAIGYNLVRPF